MNNEFIKVNGKYNIKVIDHNTKEVLQEDEVCNVITNVALSEYAKAIYDDSSNIQIKYLALGTGTVTATKSDTSLTNEVFRTEPFSTTVSGVGQVTNLFYIMDNEAQVAIGEVGIFAGTTASSATNSGKLLSRINWNYNKAVASVEIQFTRVDTFTA